MDQPSVAWRSALVAALLLLGLPGALLAESVGAHLSVGPESTGEEWIDFGPLASIDSVHGLAVRARFVTRPEPRFEVEWRPPDAPESVARGSWDEDGCWPVDVAGQRYYVVAQGLPRFPGLRVLSEVFERVVDLAGVPSWAERDVPCTLGWKVRCRPPSRAEGTFVVQFRAPDGRRGPPLAVPAGEEGEQDWGVRGRLRVSPRTRRSWSGHLFVVGPRSSLRVAELVAGCREAPAAPGPGDRPGQRPQAELGEVVPSLGLTFQGAAPSGVVTAERSLAWGAGRFELFRWELAGMDACAEGGLLLVDHRERTWCVPSWSRVERAARASGRVAIGLSGDGLLAVRYGSVAEPDRFRLGDDGLARP